MYKDFDSIDDFIEIDMPSTDETVEGSLSVNDLISGKVVRPTEFDFLDADIPNLTVDSDLTVEDIENLVVKPNPITTSFYDPNDTYFDETVVEHTSPPNEAKVLDDVVARHGAVETLRDSVYDAHNITSYNRIKIPPEAYSDSFNNSISLAQPQDIELLQLARDRDVFSLDSNYDNQIVSPTLAEFVAEYYRLINAMTFKVTLNQLVKSRTFSNTLWFDGALSQTISISSNKYFFYDSIYMYCTQDTTITSLREKYGHKKLHFTKMDVYQVMGAGKGITSAQQATIFLEKMATASFSTTISVLSYRDNMMFIKNWFEGNFTNPEFRSSVLNLVQDAVFQSSTRQALAFESDHNVFVVKDHHCLLFAKKLLDRHSNIQLPNNHLHLTALTILLSGVALKKPNLANIAFKYLFEGLKKSDKLKDSFVKLSYESHRHCYPINELSKI